MCLASRIIIIVIIEICLLLIVLDDQPYESHQVVIQATLQLFRRKK